MLRIEVILLALVAVLAIGAAAAAGASAHEWLLNGGSIASAKTVMSTGLFSLEDTKATGGAVAVHCKGFDTGTVGPGAADLVSKFTAEALGTNDKVSCTFVKTGLCKSGTTPTALAVHLPWHTEIYLAGAEVRDMVTEDGAGEPGWAVTCTNALGGQTTDTCTISLDSAGLANVTGGVDALFEEHSQSTNCSIGGAGTGCMEGTDLIENPGPSEVLTFD
jgi:hypothetical protein